MGCGKSTIGKALAQKRNIPFIDLDFYIEEKENKSISEIFKTHSEIYFRRKESEYLEEILNKKSNFILSLGGGTPCFGNNMKLISQSESISFYLNYNATTLASRLAHEQEKRPLISHLEPCELKEFINKHLFERNPYYTKADYILSPQDKTISQIVELIEEKLS